MPRSTGNGAGSACAVASGADSMGSDERVVGIADSERTCAAGLALRLP
jgi:hypothetical protein